MFDTLKIEDGVELPHLPASCDPATITWQTKDIGYPSSQTYRLTADGRLLRREKLWREKTADEKQAEASDRGFDSWDAYKEHVRETDITEKVERDLPTTVSDQTVDEVWWANHNMHGSFEFHASGGSLDGWPDIMFSYEARFYKGSLQEITLLGDRHSATDVEDVIAQLEAFDA